MFCERRPGQAATRPSGHFGFHWVDIVAPKTDHARPARPGNHGNQALLALLTTAHIHGLHPSSLIKGVLWEPYPGARH
jgi:hypothetical protein